MIHNLISLSSIVGLFFVTDEILEMKDKGKKIISEKKMKIKILELVLIFIMKKPSGKKSIDIFIILK